MIQHMNLVRVGIFVLLFIAFLGPWTLIATLVAQTTRVRLFPNAVDLPLHPPAMLAKATTTEAYR
jgi:alkanesulfonate monooxygenase SsuD/methylene tetrahydromethanopterin reductase-like flavin-dependent oxidoreductase (luciferase family)